MKNLEYKKEGGRFVIQYDGEVGKKAMAVTAGYHADDENIARLITAAPELLEALKFIVKTHEATCQGEDCNFMGLDRARFAIAKAEGK